MSNKLDRQKIDEWLWENFRYKIIGEFEKEYKSTTIQTEEGYLVKTSISDLKRGYSTYIVSKLNPYSIQNIKLWCQLNNKLFELVNNNIYANGKTKLKWKCLKEDCNEIFWMTWSAIQKHGCPYCAGKQVGLSNCLATKNPELAKEWHPTKNGDLTPYDITCGQGIKAWWICEKGHEWEAVIFHRNTSGCPICSNNQILIGFNDMWTINPELAKKLADPEGGYKYTQSSGQKVDWKCPRCGNIIKNKVINKIYKRGLFCSKCSDGIGYPEKFIYNLIEQLKESFEYQKSNFNWSKGKRYDFYLTKLDTIIETHGRQHYEELNRGIYNNKLKEIQENDKLKYDLAQTNNINNYIIIDCRYSELEYIKYNILNSRLAELYDLSNIDWLKCHELACNSFVKIVCDLWKSGIRSTKEISNKIKLSKGTIIKYLKQGTLLKWCDYDPKKNKIRRSIK